MLTTKKIIIFSPLLLAFFMALFTFFGGSFLPPKLPLFYSLPWGDYQLAGKLQLLIIPASIALISLFNLTASWQLHTSQVFFKRVLTLSSLLVSLILTITFIKIVLIFL